MANQSQPGNESSRVRGPAPAWLRLATVCVLLVVVPTAVYLFLYRSSRVEQATIRNFRTLDAAAERVVEVLGTLTGVVDSSSFGISPSMLDEVTERLTGQTDPIAFETTGCTDTGGPQPLPWRSEDDVAFPNDLFRLRQPTAEQRREFAYRLAAYLLVQSNKRDKRSTEKLWNQLHCLVDTHRKYSAPIETIEVDVNPLPRTPLLPSREHCGDRMSAIRCGASLRERLTPEACSAPTRSPRLSATATGTMAATVVDCRPFEARSSGELHKALKTFHGADGVIAAIDLFGTSSTAQLDALMREATEFLARFFDSHMIADGDGRILYEAEVSTTSETEADESHVATPAFSSLVDITELLRIESASSDRGGSRAAPVGNNRPTTLSVPSFHGRSFVETVRVGNVELRVFVHPFIMDGIDVSVGTDQSSEERQTSANRAARPTYYMVGIVDDAEFQSAAIKLRLSLVINATLILLVLLTLCPLLWFWTADDRLLITRLGLASICTTPVVGVVLFVVLACGVLTNHADQQVLDSTMEQVSNRIVKLFDQELHRKIRELQGKVHALLQRAQRKEPSRPPGGNLEQPKSTTGGRQHLNQLERAFYCDDSHRDLPYDPSGIGRTNVLLLSDAGRALVCASSGSLTRTPRLDLAFRGYFQRPKAGELWSPKPVDLHQPVPCHVDGSQDHESLIPCIVDGLPGPWKRPSTFGTTSRFSTDVREVPYYLERIDSIVRGDVQTILAINTKKMRRPVAFTGVRLGSLDRAVPPPHIHFAVIDRETGHTLFHSDDDLAMVTNFADDIGGEPALWSLLHSGTRGTVGFVYTGIPIRAHVRPLRDGMPWALIVYRGHELEDRLTAVTTALAVFFTLLSLVVVVGLAGLILLPVHWWKSELLRSGPASLGGVLATGARYRWTAGAAIVGLALVFLLYIPWLTWSPWPLWNPWRVSPVLAVHLVIAVVAFLLIHVLGEQRPTPKGDEAPGPDTSRKVLLLAVVIVCFAVLPAALWFGHHRAALGVGLDHYLVDRTLESVERAREAYRLDMLREFGGGNAPERDRMALRPLQEQQTDEGWIYGVLRSLLGFSKLSDELMVYRALPPATTDEVVSLYGAFGKTFGYGIRPPFPERSPFWSGPLFVMATLSLLLITALIGGIAYSILKVCTIVRGERYSRTELRDAGCILQGKADEPLRGIVVCGNPTVRDIFIGKLDERYRVARHRHSVARSAVLSPPRVGWKLEEPKKQPQGPEKRPLYFFDDLEETLTDNAKGRALFKELTRLLDDEITGSAVLVWSAVAPDYRYSRHLGSAERPFDSDRADIAGRRDRWHELDGLRSYALREEQRLGGIRYFEEVWTQSMMDERLQLYMLARCGVVNSHRTAALSSLVKRGIATVDAAGVVQLSDERLGEFIAHDIDHGDLHAWRKEGGGGVWRMLWPPLAIGAGLGLAFLAMANPEMRTTLFTALLGLLPTALPFLRGAQGSGST